MKLFLLILALLAWGFYPRRPGTPSDQGTGCMSGLGSH